MYNSSKRFSETCFLNRIWFLSFIIFGHCPPLSHFYFIFLQAAEMIALHVHRMFSVYLTLVTLVEGGGKTDYNGDDHNNSQKSSLNLLTHGHHQTKVMLQQNNHHHQDKNLNNSSSWQLWFCLTYLQLFMRQTLPACVEIIFKYVIIVFFLSIWWWDACVWGKHVCTLHMHALHFLYRVRILVLFYLF